MDFTTKKILNNGRYILSIIFGFLNAITYFIIPYFNANIATKVVQNNFSRTFLSKSESSTLPASPPPSSPSATTTTRRRRRTRTPSTFSSKSESSTLATLPPSPPSAAAITTTRTKTTRTPSISKSESSTSTPPSPSLSATTTTTTTTTRTKTTRTPSIWKSETLTSIPPSSPPLSSTTTTMRGTTTRMPSIFFSKSESTSTPPLALLSPPPPPPTTTTPSTFSSLFDSTPYSSPWMYSTSGDLIGSESGVFMASPSELEEYEQQYRNRKPKNNIVKKEKQPKNSKKEYPPPIPSWRGKLPRDIPWSLSRHNIDGRLVLKEENMEYYEYLEATRENGRLVLKLIVFKGNIKCHDQNDLDDTIHDDEITRDETINRKEKKKRIQEETQKEFKMINRDIGTKKRRGHY